MNRNALRAIFTTNIYLLHQFTTGYCETSNKDKKSAADCHIPACSSTMEMLKLAKQKREQMNSSSSSSASSTHSTKSTDRPRNVPAAHNPYKVGCPVLREELGISTWKLIHTIAANFPEHPTEAEKENVTRFFESLSNLYPCPHCAEDFKSAVANHPPR